MPFTMVKLWKSLARGKENKIPLSHFGFASSEIQGSAGGSGHMITSATRVSVMCENKNMLAADFSSDNYFLRSMYYGWRLLVIK